jgi:lysozyme
MNREIIAKVIEGHEGKRNVAYTDTKGILTVGIGFNLERHGAYSSIVGLDLNYDDVCMGKCKLTDEHIETLFDIDLTNAMEDTLDAVINLRSLPEDVQTAMVDMMFNLGYAKFIKFKKLIAALEHMDYCTAAIEMQNSEWAKQVPNRAKDDIQLVQRFCHQQ